MVCNCLLWMEVVGMNTCKDCKWWGSPDFAAYSTCHKNDKTEDVVCDDCALDGKSSCYGKAHLTFHKNFGCIHWEKKE